MLHEGSHSNVKIVEKFWNDSTQNNWIHVSEKHGRKILKFENTKLKPCCKKYIFDLLCKNFLFLLFLFNSVLFILYIYTTWLVLTLGIDNVRMVKISLNLGSQVKMFGPLIQKIVLKKKIIGRISGKIFLEKSSEISVTFDNLEEMSKFF